MGETIVPPDAANALAVGIIWLPISIFIVLLRFYARRQQNARLGADDWLIIPACLLTIGMCVVMIYGAATKSLGYPTPVPPPDQDPLTFRNKQITIAKQAVWSMELLQVPGLGFTKLSCLFFYRRIFNTGQTRIFNWITIFLISFIIVWVLTFEFALAFECKGHFAAWWTTIKDLSLYCTEALDIELAYAVTDSATDLAVIVIPIPPVLKLKMSTPRKVAVLAIFFLGALTLAVSLTRMVIFVEAIIALREDYHTTGADNLTVTSGLYWTLMESGLAILGACLPTIYSLARDIIAGGRKRRSAHSYTMTELSSPSKRARPWFSISNWTDSTGTGSGSRTGADNRSLHDQAPIISKAPYNAEIESHAVTENARSSSDVTSVESGQIRVQKTFDRTEQMA